jgi:predicted transcriptional regulator of viral defense system
MSARKSTRQYRHTLSEREAKILSSLSYRGRTIFTADELRQLTNDPKNVLDWLSRKKWLLKIRKGVYAIVPFEAGELGSASYTLHSFVIASFLVEPYYIGYWSALNHHGLTDQTPPAVYVATTKPKNSRAILDTRFRFVTIPKRKMFGVDETEIEKRKVRISSREKTIVDCLDHPEHCGGVEEAAKALYFARDEIDFENLVKLAERIGNNAVLKRLGYIAEAMRLDECSALLSAVTLKSGYSALDPTLRGRGKIRERWKLIVNIPIDPARWSR